MKSIRRIFLKKVSVGWGKFDRDVEGGTEDLRMGNFSINIWDGSEL